MATPIIFAEFTELVADSVKWLEKEAQRKADSAREEDSSAQEN
jgi:hypothetical protein